MDTLPDWLRPTDEQLLIQDQKFPMTKDHKELRRILYESVFERVVECLEAGNPVSRTLREDPREIDVGQFMAWVRRDAERFKRFEEAKRNGMLILEDKLLEIADGEESTEDVQRSKLRADTIKFIMQSWDKRYKTDNKETGNQFAGGVTIVIGEVESPYKRESLVIENGST